MGDENNSTFQGVETQMAHSSLQEVTNHHSVIPSTDGSVSSVARTATSRDLHLTNCKNGHKLLHLIVRRQKRRGNQSKAIIKC